MILPDVLRPGLRVVFCGSAVGAHSAQVGAYYAKPGNKFWPTLAAVGLTPRQFAPAEYPRLLDHGIGLTDLVKTQSGNDTAIRFGAADRERLRTTISEVQPRYLCFTSKRAVQEFLDIRHVEYGLQGATIGATRLFVAPSTSGLASRSWDIGVWHALARLVRS